MAKGDDIEARLVAFAVEVLDLCDQLPKTVAGNHIAGQLLRSGTSPARNCGGVRGAESTRGFVHKLGVVLKELNESRIWLRILEERRMLPTSRVTPLHEKCDQLCRIIVASRRTAEGNMKGKL